MRDVRMKGFSKRADVEEVEAFLDANAAVLPAEEVPLLDAIRRVLAEEVTAAVSVPGFPRSAMDGYAVRGEDTFGGSDYDPIFLELQGLSLPGKPFDGILVGFSRAHASTHKILRLRFDGDSMSQVLASAPGSTQISPSLMVRTEMKEHRYRSTGTVKV